MRARRWGRRKRRLAVLALGALAVAVAASLLAPGAGAVVANPGEIKVTMRLSVITPTFTVTGASTDGTGIATLRKNGLINIPQSSLQFPPAAVHIDIPAPPPDPSTADTIPPIAASSTIAVSIVPTSDFYGGVDPNNGSGFLVGNVKLLWDQTGTLTGCTVGPIRVVARTGAQGARPYSAATGKVTMVDSGFTADAVPAGATGCGGYEYGLNAALSLPVTTTTTTTLPGTPTTMPPTFPPDSQPPVPSVVMALTLTPPPRRVPVVPPQRPVPPPTSEPQVTTVHPPTALPPPPGVATPGRTKAPPPPARRHARHRYRPAHGPRPRHHRPLVTVPVTGTGKTPHPKRHVRPRHRHAVTRGTYLPGGKQPVPRRVRQPEPRQQQLAFLTTAFVKPPPSVLATGLDVVALLGMLVFSSLALWLVTSEVSALSASARRLRTHRIAGVTRRD